MSAVISLYLSGAEPLRTLLFIDPDVLIAFLCRLGRIILTTTTSAAASYVRICCKSCSTRPDGGEQRPHRSPRSHVFTKPSSDEEYAEGTSILVYGVPG